MDTIFKEEQKFTQWWIWLILAVFVGVLIAEYVESRSDPLALIVMLVVLVLFIVLKLKTTIDKSGIKMRFFPFLSKDVKWKEIKKVSVIEYSFVGGWGIRLFTKYGTAYNVRGKNGLFVELKNGKTFLIGTQEEEELKKALKALRKG